ncbi:MAG: BrnT family toxin [Candidatus Limnocylindrales bacterium]|jgi:hypothetical protein
MKDPNRVSRLDLDHTDIEERFLTVGYSSRGRLLAVVTAEQPPGIIRIISARRATKREHMRTKPAPSDEERIRAFHEKLDQPSIVEIDDATAYRLEGEDGRRIGEESPTSEAPLAIALAEIRRGVDPIRLSLVCDTPDEGRYVITTGDFLAEFAEYAAGIPARPRIPAPGAAVRHSGDSSVRRTDASVTPSAQSQRPAPGSRHPKGR